VTADLPPPQSDHWSDSLAGFAYLWLLVGLAVLLAGDGSTAAPLFAAAVINIWMIRSRRNQARRNPDLMMFAFNLFMAALVIGVSTYPWKEIPGLSRFAYYGFWDGFYRMFQHAQQ